MRALSYDSAREFVRKNLDEQYLDIVEMYTTEDSDNEALDDIILRSMAEAVRDVHLAAPAAVLDGKQAAAGVDYEVRPGGEVAMLTDVLRLVSFRAADSPIVVCGAVEEDSPEGRMQLSPHTRGTYDDPVLVLTRASAGSLRPVWRYYSLREGASPQEGDPVAELTYVPPPVYLSDTYEISSTLEYHVLNYLTGLVLQVLGETERAGVFFQRSAFVQTDGR